MQVMSNGNLILPPFRAEDYSQEVHAQTYRCLAQNTFGKIQSREVHVRAGKTVVAIPPLHWTTSPSNDATFSTLFTSFFQTLIFSNKQKILDDTKQIMSLQRNTKSINFYEPCIPRVFWIMIKHPQRVNILYIYMDNTSVIKWLSCFQIWFRAMWMN